MGEQRIDQLSDRNALLLADRQELIRELQNCVWLLADLQKEPGLVQQQARALLARLA